MAENAGHHGIKNGDFAGKNEDIMGFEPTIYYSYYIYIYICIYIYTVSDLSDTPKIAI